MPSFWQGFGSHGSLKYCGQLWSSKGPVFSTDLLCRLGCSRPRLLGSAFSSKAFPEPSSEGCCSWPWRMRPWGISLVSLTRTSVWLRWVISWGNRQRVVGRPMINIWLQWTSTPGECSLGCPYPSQTAPWLTWKVASNPADSHNAGYFYCSSNPITFLCI